MKRIASIILGMIIGIGCFAQTDDYEFLIFEGSFLSQAYPRGARATPGEWKAISYKYPHAFIYSDKACGFYDIPSQLESGFDANCKDLQREDTKLFWERVKQIKKNIDENLAKHKNNSGQDEVGSINGKSKVLSETDSSSSSDRIYDVAEHMPSFPGGTGALMHYIASNVKYPADAKKKGIQGRVLCTFVVEKDGRVTNVDVKYPEHPSLDKEARRVINSMPRWIPGRQGDKAIRVKYTLPISFKLQ